MTESPFVDSGFAVPVFSPGDDPIACLNKAMAFLTVVASSRFPSTNNQLRTSSNLRNQATIQDGRVTVQQVQGRQGQNYSAKRQGIMQDPRIPAGQAQTIIPHNASFQTEDLDTYDSDCDDLSTHKRFLWPTFPIMVLMLSQRNIDFEEEIDQKCPEQAKDSEMDVPIELPKVGLVNASLKKLKFHLTQFDIIMKKRTTPNALEEASMQLKQEVFQNNESCVSQNAVEIPEYFEINDLKARLQDKDKTICKLKDTIKSLSDNTKEDNVNHDKCDLDPINKELENSVAKLLSENERLCHEINHVKHVFKDQFDSLKQTRVHHKETKRTLKINKLNLKSVENEDLKAQIQDKLDLVLLPPRLLKNKDVHIDYLRHTQEQANNLREIVKQAKVKQPLDRELDFACKYAIRIQELLVYVQDTCPNAITPSTKKADVESSNTSDSNTPVLSSIGVKCSTSNCGSKPPGNKKNDRISQTPSRNKKNKVEAQPRKVNKMNRVVKPVCDVDVKHSLSNANS
ncbi:hypothetical protein Tco_1457594 [Tanacetum coccineum]